MADLIDFATRNWFLFAALAAVGFMLILGEIKRIRSGITPLSAQHILRLINDDEQQVAIIDVREPAEYKQGHLPDAHNIPWSEWARRVHELDKYKNGAIVVYCAQGMRSTDAAAALRKAGFTQVHTLLNGLLSWQEANLPLRKKK